MIKTVLIRKLTTELNRCKNSLATLACMGKSLTYPGRRTKTKKYYQSRIARIEKILQKLKEIK